MTLSRARVLVEVVSLALMTACGSGGGGGSWQDDWGRKGFAPEPGEDSAELFTLPAGLTLKQLSYSKDPDLVLARLENATGEDTYYLLRLSAKSATPYCGKVAVAQVAAPLEPEVSTAAFGLVGDTLVFFAPVVDAAAYDARVVCTKGTGGSDLGAVMSKEKIPAPYVSNGPSALMRALSANGFWTTGRDGTGPKLMEVRYDGTVTTIALDASQDHGHRFDIARNAFFYIAGADVKKVDLGTQAITTVGSGVNALSLTLADEHGVLAQTASGGAVVHLDASAPTVVPSATLGTGPTDLYFESDGKGVVVGTARYDTKTGQTFSLMLDGELAANALKYTRSLSRSGHAYLLGPYFDPLEVWVAPSSSPATFARATPNYRVEVTPGRSDLAQEMYSQANPKQYSLRDGSCILFTGRMEVGPGDGPPKAANLQGNLNDFGRAGEVWPFVGRRGVVWSKCGDSKGTVLSAFGVGPSQSFSSFQLGGSSFRDDRPFFAQMYVRVRGAERATNDPSLGTRYWDYLESGWTVTPDGRPVPLYKLAERAWLRAQSFENFIVKRDDKLFVARGYKP